MSYNAVDKTTGNLIKIAGNASAAGGSGHVILNPAGTSMAQEDNLQFTGSSITIIDDSVNGKTVVNIDADKIFKGTSTQWEQLTLAEKTAYDATAFTDDYDDPAKVGNLSDLVTTNKSSIVAAINEIATQLNNLGLSVVNGEINTTYTEE